MHDELDAEEFSDPKDRDEYLAENAFWVPQKARWSTLSKNSKDPGIGIDLSPKFIQALRGVLGVKSLALGHHLVHRLSLQKFHWRQVVQC